MTIIHSSPPSILVRRTGALGDVLETTPIIRRLRAENPRHQIFVQTDYPSVFWANPDISGASPTTNLIYTCTIDLNMAFENRLRQLHPIDAYSEVAFGDRNTAHRLIFYFEPMAMRRDWKVAVIHPCRNWPIRTLPLEFWQELVDLLIERGFQVTVTGTHQDHDGLKRVLDLRSRLTLAEQATLIDSSACFICSESGPMILAQTTSTPVIAMTTMAHPDHVKHLREAPFHVIPTPLGCGGCESRFDAPTTYWGCPLGHGDCVCSFSPPVIADLAATLAQARRTSAVAAA